MASTSDGSTGERTDIALPAFVDWILGALIALVGLASIVIGSVFMFLVDRDDLAEGIEGGTITVTVATTELTDAEMLEVTDAVATWGGTGLLVTGAALVIIAVAYVTLRHRSHRKAASGEEVSSYWAYALLGAVATAVLSFIPFSSVIGGGLAGYLEARDSDRTISVGVFAGLLPVVPVLVVLLFVLGGLLDGFLAIGESGIAIVIGATLVLAALFAATISAGVGGLGGYLGGKLREGRNAET